MALHSVAIPEQINPEFQPRLILVPRKSHAPRTLPTDTAAYRRFQTAAENNFYHDIISYHLQFESKAANRGHNKLRKFIPALLECLPAEVPDFDFLKPRAMALQSQNANGDSMLQIVAGLNDPGMMFKILRLIGPGDFMTAAKTCSDETITHMAKQIYEYHVRKKMLQGGVRWSDRWLNTFIEKQASELQLTPHETKKMNRPMGQLSFAISILGIQKQGAALPAVGARRAGPRLVQ